MFEVTTTYTRKTTDNQFCIFQTSDIELLTNQAAFRNEMMEAPGFIGITYVISEDKLAVEVITLWESEELAYNFRPLYKDSFITSLVSYNKRVGHGGKVKSSTIHDTKNLKLKKLSTRITYTDAGQYLRDFITSSK